MDRENLIRIGTIQVAGGWVSPNRTKGKHWGNYTHHKRIIKREVASNVAMFSLDERDVLLLGAPDKRYLDFTVATQRVPDPDNLVAGLKILIDCMKKIIQVRLPTTEKGKKYRQVVGPHGVGLIWDDNPKFLEILGVRSETNIVQKGAKKCTNVVIVDIYE